MESSPSPVAASEVRDLQFTSRWLWRATWASFGVVLAVGVLDYLTIFMSPFIPLWLWCLVGGGLALAAAAFAVNVDVVDARRKRGRRVIDLVARLAAALVLGLWLVALGVLGAGGCFTNQCVSVSLWVVLLTQVPIVQLGGLTLVGFLVRRDARRHT